MMSCLLVVYVQNEDGGWGLHIEGHSIMFSTALNYVTLRLLGEEVDGGEGSMQKARAWILHRGGATHIPSWGKLWLSVTLHALHFSFHNSFIIHWIHSYIMKMVGAWRVRMERHEPNSTGDLAASLLCSFPPRLLRMIILSMNIISFYYTKFVMKKVAGRMWCHSRLVYLPMSYLYGRRFVGPINAIILSLRKELYTLPYHILSWDHAKNLCAKVFCSVLVNFKPT